VLLQETGQLSCHEIGVRTSVALAVGAMTLAGASL
jgi:hypothetical protein